MTRLCLDTSAYSNFRRGHADVAAHLDRAAWVGVPSVVLGELAAGFILGNRRDENERELQQFLHHSAVDVVPTDEHVASIYGEIVVALRRQGTPVPTNDIWIAAAAASVGATVVTFDQHFSQIGRVGSLVLSFKT